MSAAQLDEFEIMKLTRQTNKRKQCEVLKKLGVPFKPLLDDSPCVSRDVFNEWTRGDTKQGKATVNLSAISRNG